MTILDHIGGTRILPLRHLAPGRTVVTLAVDSGMKYLSTELYSGR